jgi:hypothetical protein
LDLSTFIVAVFCLIDVRLKDLGRLRARGPPLALFDSDVPTIEVVGEFLALDETRNPSSTSGATTATSSRSRDPEAVCV